ncbi:LysR family transcriptional regulator [Ramlibacter sp. Leaf400]|uniref:LysR family transcriptional regulator n=1 Tax=Ramlibacter sp. Leaf400 TaxID=1736365 RepID=UPI0007013C44|nr:LysR family transcriptional regulator [Ramlibacter sp. Leaf400]KQT11347.1 LysR family transcriptional regulator [Ramlibacter sp. Leaf400]
MNFTFRQLETFLYSARLRSFNAAAVQLHTTQSAVSKRVAELEQQVGSPLLLRSARGLQLTQTGRRLLPLAEQALALWTRIDQEFAAGETLRGNFRVGVTEFIALTWLTRLIQRVQENHPDVTLEPVVDVGVRLFDRLAAQQIDVCIMPGTFWGSDYSTVKVGQVEELWVVSPRLQVPRALEPHEFADYPVIEESTGASKKMFYEEWRARQGYRFGKVLHINSTTLLRDLTVRGFGISQLSREYVGEDLKAGRLRVVKTEKLPPMVYSAVYRTDTATPALRRIVELAVESCDFARSGSEHTVVVGKGRAGARRR